MSDFYFHLKKKLVTFEYFNICLIFVCLRDPEDGGSDTEQQSPLWVLISDSEITTTAQQQQQQQQHWLEGGLALGGARGLIELFTLQWVIYQREKWTVFNILTKQDASWDKENLLFLFSQSNELHQPMSNFLLFTGVCETRPIKYRHVLQFCLTSTSMVFLGFSDLMVSLSFSLWQEPKERQCCAWVCAWHYSKEHLKWVWAAFLRVQGGF